MYDYSLSKLATIFKLGYPVTFPFYPQARPRLGRNMRGDVIESFSADRVKATVRKGEFPAG